MITAEKIKELRDKTLAGMMDCKNALKECDGNMEAAADWLRKKGLVIASKKASRAAADGVVAVCGDSNKMSVIEFNSETDFVAKNPSFQALALKIAGVAHTAESVESLKASKPEGFSKIVSDEIVEQVAIIGENLNLRRIATLHTKNGVVAHYIHNSIADNIGKIGVLVALEVEGNANFPAAELQTLGKQIGMHIAAINPDALTIEELNPEVVEKKRKDFKAEAIASGKPEEVAQKMVEGKVRKFYEEVVLLEQPFVMDNQRKISAVLEDASKKIGAKVTITGYVRFALGEGIEKPQSDFAEEVAGMLK